MSTGEGTSKEGAGLPNSIEVLWELRNREQRTARIGLSVERIVAAAIESADADGLAGLSMSRVAKSLDFGTMSLYRHVSSKDELCQLMLDMAYGTPPHIDMVEGDWRAGLEQWARAFQEVFRRHPWMLQISVSGPPLEPGQPPGRPAPNAHRRPRAHTDRAHRLALVGRPRRRWRRRGRADHDAARRAVGKQRTCVVS